MTTLNLSAALRQHVLSSIRAGAYPHAAAEAWGVPAQSIGDLLQQGETAGEDAPLVAEVRQAHAMARTVAETKLFAKDPKLWLMHGPGRETADAPGWTANVKPAEPGPPAANNAWLEPTLLRFLADLLDVLTSFPEAHRRATQSMHAAGIEAVIVRTEVLVIHAARVQRMIGAHA